MRSKLSQVATRRILPFLGVIFLLLIVSGSAFAADSQPDVPVQFSSLIPPLVAIAVALIVREVITALTLGVFSGLIIYNWHTGESLGNAILQLPESVVESATDSSHMAVILFSLFVGGIVQLISKNGGMQAIVDWVSKRAKDARSGQLATWFLGIFIFFDDYANTLVVGNTMRPLTDKLKISREKLAYIVDSTAAPIAATAFVTTWIGAELEYIEKGVEQLPAVKEMGISAYALFMSSLKYSFYPFLTLFFIFILIWKRKDFGPMLKAEKNARLSETTQMEEENKEDEKSLDPPKRAFNALIPILLLVVGTLSGLYYTGMQSDSIDPSKSGFAQLSTVIGASDSFAALLWASFGALVVTILLTVSQRLMNLEKALENMWDGIKHMLPAIGILILAWALGSITEQLKTAEYVADILTGQLPPAWFPAVTFLIAAAIAFATGSSWGTMAILYPVVLVTSWKISIASGLDQETSLAIMTNCISCVLAGSVLGDHCSPISDTTILSSLASQCDHVQHVRTQMPYALTVGGVSVILGTLLTGYGMPWYMGFILGAISLFFIVSYFGKMAPDRQYSSELDVTLLNKSGDSE